MIRSRQLAFTLVEIMIVIAIISILSGIAIPKYMRARGEARLSACEENLRTIALAVEMCRTRHPELVRTKGQTLTMVIDSSCPLYELGYLKSIPRCPGDTKGTGLYQLWDYGTWGYYYIRHNGSTGAHEDVGIKYPFPRYQSRGQFIEESL